MLKTVYLFIINICIINYQILTNSILYGSFVVVVVDLKCCLS